MLLRALPAKPRLKAPVQVILPYFAIANPLVFGHKHLATVLDVAPVIILRAFMLQ